MQLQKNKLFMLGKEEMVFTGNTEYAQVDFNLHCPQFIYGSVTNIHCAFVNYYPVGIWCKNDVLSTSMGRNHVASTLIRRILRHVTAE